ncbi:hypothetical protein ONZ45_g17482 [Pleurotus djamor]|nr:hypothetical protein ONZ45_g17482 [Pleurotus djamor]
MPTWVDRYNELFIKKKFVIPDRASTTSLGKYVETRDLSLDLSESLRSSSTFRYLYADSVTTTSHTIALPANGGINIVTRVFLADCLTPEIVLECPKGPSGFILYTLEFLSGTRITVKTAAGSRDFVPTLAPDECGVRVIIDATGTVEYRVLSWIDNNEFKVDGQLHRLLRTQFAVASAWLGSEASTPFAMDILTFILRLTRASQLATDIRMQALTLYAQSAVRGDAKAKGLTYVPRLDFSVYDTVVDRNIKVAQAYEQQYERYSDLAAGSQVWIESATVMKEQYTDLSNMCKTLASQAQDRYDSAEKALRENNNAFEDAKSAVTHAQDALAKGYLEWLIKQHRETLIAVFKALFDLGVAVGECVLGQPEAAEAAVEAGKAAEKAYEAAEAVVEAGSLVDKLIKGIKELPKIFKKMSGIASAISALFISIGKAIANASSPNPEVDAPDADTSTNFIGLLASWDVYLDELDSSMKFPISEGISGAEEYRLASRKMAILGKALLLSKMAAISQGQELARTLMQLYVNEKQQERLADWITKLETSNEAYLQAQVLLFNRLLDVRGWIYIYLQSYIDSYRYWALTPSTVQPSMVETVPQFEKDHATLAIEVVQAYTHFDPSPQDFHRVFNWGVGRSFLTEDVLESLKATSTASFSITPEHLPGYTRVRVKTIRLYLKDIDGTDEEPVRIEITNDGTYHDITPPKGGSKSEYLNFYSEPLRRAFQYTSEGRPPVIDGDVAFPAKYFLPTPFTKWTVTVKSDFDPAQLSGLKLELHGEAIVV